MSSSTSSTSPHSGHPPRSCSLPSGMWMCIMEMDGGWLCHAVEQTDSSLNACLPAFISLPLTAAAAAAACPPPTPQPPLPPPSPPPLPSLRIEPRLHIQPLKCQCLCELFYPFCLFLKLLSVDRQRNLAGRVGRLLPSEKKHFERGEVKLGRRSDEPSVRHVPRSCCLLFV